MPLNRYCVLWIPTRLHKEIRPISSKQAAVNPEIFSRSYVKDGKGYDLLDEEIVLENILASDEEENKVYLDLTLLPEGVHKISGVLDTTCECHIAKRDIEIKAKNAVGEIIDTLYLRCLDARRNGLFMYEYEVHEKYLDETHSKNKYLLNSNQNITNVLYHSIKSFYHVHEFHSQNKDSILHPFSSEVRINLNCPNNPALLHYLDEFEKKFLDEDEFTKSLKACTDKNYEKLLSQKKEIDASIDFESYKNIIYKIVNCMEVGYIECMNQCNSVLNIHIYYQTLFYSKYNKIFNLKCDSSHKYELYEVCQRTGYTRKSRLTLKDYNNQVDIPACHRKSDDSLSAEQCYKKAINIHNAIESISLRQKEVSTIINREFLTLIYSYSNLINVQADDIQQQTVAIQTQAQKVELQTQEIKKLTKETSDFSGELTRRSTWIGVIAGFCSSAVFFFLSLFIAYSPESDLLELNKEVSTTKEKLQEQSNTRDRELLEVKKMLIDLNERIVKQQETKQNFRKNKI